MFLFHRIWTDFTNHARKSAQLLGLLLHFLLYFPHTDRKNGISTHTSFQPTCAWRFKFLSSCQHSQGLKTFKQEKFSGKFLFPSFFKKISLVTAQAPIQHLTPLSWICRKLLWVNKKTKENILAIFAVGIEMSSFLDNIFSWDYFYSLPLSTAFFWPDSGALKVMLKRSSWEKFRNQ